MNEGNEQTNLFVNDWPPPPQKKTMWLERNNSIKSCCKELVRNVLLWSFEENLNEIFKESSETLKEKILCKIGKWFVTSWLKINQLHLRKGQQQEKNSFDTNLECL